MSNTQIRRLYIVACCSLAEANRTNELFITRREAMQDINFWRKEAHKKGVLLPTRLRLI